MKNWVIEKLEKCSGWLVICLIIAVVVSFVGGTIWKMMPASNAWLTEAAQNPCMANLVLSADSKDGAIQNSTMQEFEHTCARISEQEVQKALVKKLSPVLTNDKTFLHLERKGCKITKDGEPIYLDGIKNGDSFVIPKGTLISSECFGSSIPISKTSKLYDCEDGHVRYTIYGTIPTSIPLWVQGVPVVCGSEKYSLDGKEITELQLLGFINEDIIVQTAQDQALSNIGHEK